jgi:myosin protein heavy chain
VLDTVTGFRPPQLRQEHIENHANIFRRIWNLLMDEMKKFSTVISFHMKQEATTLASDWKANIAVADKGCLEVLDFLKFVATYEIGSFFGTNELQRLQDIIAHHCQAPLALANIEKPPGKYLVPSSVVCWN